MVTLTTFNLMSNSTFAAALPLAFAMLGVCAQATTPPSAPPVTVDASLPNLFYGAVPPNGPRGPVVVFVHGIGGTFQDWLEAQNCPASMPSCTGTSNDMYDLAYQAGLRTAFMSLSADNSPNEAGIQTNAAVLQTVFPKILAAFSVTKVYFVAHSKGGLDLEAAIATPQWLGIANAVLEIGTPNQGDALADWLFSAEGQPLGKKLGLLTPAMQSMQIANVLSLRSLWDPIFQKSGIPFYTMGGVTFTCPESESACITATTGPILEKITGGKKAPPNDGIVDLEETLLPATYAMELAFIPASHFNLRLGDNSFVYIHAHLVALDNQQPGVQRTSTGGFGDLHNTWAWSMAWFNNKLYVGTGREVNCVTYAEAAIKLGIPSLYPPPQGDCPPDYHYLPLQAEIWQYDPPAGIWTLVFQSPNSLTTTANDGATVATARDIGFRGMQIVQEPGGVQALYAGGVTSGQIFETAATFGTWAPPRILRTTDGLNWAPIPQNTSVNGVCPAMSCFLGDLTQNGVPHLYGNYSIRSGAQLNAGQPNSILFLQVGDFIGVGRVISSVPGINPALGDDCGQPVCYQWASSDAASLPVWILESFNNFVYVGTGNPPTFPTVTYGVFKTDGTGAAPYNWTPVIVDGGYATGLVADYAMSMQIFTDPQACPGIGCLYVGTDEANELVRIHPDITGVVPVDSVDSWDLVVGNPRTVPQGQPGAGTVVDPVTGIGQFFDNGFTGHFWKMGVGGQGLYMGTWDWSADNVSAKGFGPLWSQEYGTDIWRTPDGTHWSFVSKIGLGDGNNTGGRSFATTPFGLYMGTARSIGGTQTFMLDNTNLDFNHDGTIDQADVNLMQVRVNSSAKPNDPMDLDRDGKITEADVELLKTQCTYPGCAAPAARPATAALTAPVLYSAPGALAAGAPVSLSWNAVSGAYDYLVYRIAVSGSESTPPPAAGNAAAAACRDAAAANLALCSQLAEAHGTTTNPLFGYPGQPTLLKRVTTPAYSELAPNSLQSLYFVRAEDSSGNLSPPSNVAGGPSLAAQ
jgi:hypothetical protein